MWEDFKDVFVACDFPTNMAYHFLQVLRKSFAVPVIPRGMHLGWNHSENVHRKYKGYSHFVESNIKLHNLKGVSYQVDGLWKEPQIEKTIESLFPYDAYMHSTEFLSQVTRFTSFGWNSV